MPNRFFTTKAPGARGDVSRTFLTWILALWAILIVAGFSALAAYEMTPGRAGAAPADSTSLSPAKTETYTLVMAAHPRCPCTRASMNELAVLMTRLRGRMTATVWFYAPPGSPEEWARTGLWKAAAALPGVTVKVDPEGRAASELGAETSGQVLLFDPAGRRIFAGGITGARGHEGDNAGLRAVEALVLGKTMAATTTTPVFGCSILDIPDDGGIAATSARAEETVR